mmetsp:Transcript_9204/g.21390  ORF Transcript_9204/g.21390 Transcript_9204/m.21390 type:complete len:244 (+) Transcript_9204:153-884(+)
MLSAAVRSNRLSRPVVDMPCPPYASPAPTVWDRRPRPGAPRPDECCGRPPPPRDAEPAREDRSPELAMSALRNLCIVSSSPGTGSAAGKDEKGAAFPPPPPDAAPSRLVTMALSAVELPLAAPPPRSPILAAARRRTDRSWTDTAALWAPATVPVGGGGGGWDDAGRCSKAPASSSPSSSSPIVPSLVLNVRNSFHRWFRLRTFRSFSTPSPTSRRSLNLRLFLLAFARRTWPGSRTPGRGFW